jgi:hypothetical protein
LVINHLIYCICSLSSIWTISCHML